MRNDGGAIWTGTRLWSDQVWISPDPTFIPSRAVSLGSFVHAVGTGLAHGESYTQTAEVTLPAGFGGAVLPLRLRRTTPAIAASTARKIRPAATSATRGPYYGTHVWEDGQGNNLARGDINVTYREPDLQVTSIQAADIADSGSHQTRHLHRQQRRHARHAAGPLDRPRLPVERPVARPHDLQIGEVLHFGALGVGASYSQTISFDVPGGRERALLPDRLHRLRRVRHQPAAAPPCRREVGQVRLVDDAVPEFKDEGNNTTVRPLDVVLRPAPDLRVTRW